MPAMNKAQLRERLKELSFSAQLPDKVVDHLAEISLAIDYPAGSVLFREGSVNDTLYLVCWGTVALEMNVPARGAARLLTLGPGDLVAWSSLLNHGEMTATAIVTEDAQLIAISAPKLRRLCEADHELGFQFMRRLSQALAKRLVATRLQLLDLFSHEPPVIKS